MENEKNDSFQTETSPPVLYTNCVHSRNNSCSFLEEKDTFFSTTLAFEKAVLYENVALQS